MSKDAGAAILFEPDAYVLTGSKLMGRQAAGNAFLRAAVRGRRGQPLSAYTGSRRSAEVFGELVHAFDPTAEARWLPADRLDMLSRLGTLYLPGPGLDAAARLRLRAGPGAYSLCGVTHTTASHAAMDAIVGMFVSPVMPWDALICTSHAVAGTVKVLLEAEIAFLRWRLGPTFNVILPQLPIIPLGVHCDDFQFSVSQRNEARAALGIADDEVVALFVGRLSFHAKAHPHAMYLGLQAAAERSGKKLVLVQAGWFANDHIEAAFKAGAAAACPDVRALFIDGREPDNRQRGWAAADMFVSLSDNIQETFGLAPIEAMAAGLPVVVSDWDGYKDTVRDGVDGFRIPTWMPPPELGEPFARAHEAGIDSYDFYCGLTCQTVSVDLRQLGDRLCDLAVSTDLRRQMGEAGRIRARQVFDWTVVYEQYRGLWGELGKIRRTAVGDANWQERLRTAPKAAPGRLDPFRGFGHYPTALIRPTTRVTLRRGASLEAYRDLCRQGLFSYADKILPTAEVADKLISVLHPEGLDLQTLASRAVLDLGLTVLAVAVLAKMGLVSLAPGNSDG